MKQEIMCDPYNPVQAINTNKKVFIQELIALCKKHRLRFDEYDGLLSISAIDNDMEYGEDLFIEWLEEAVDYEANEARFQCSPKVTE